MKCVEFPISGRKLCTPVFLNEIWGVSHFRQENLHLNFPAWSMENLTSFAGKSAPQFSWMTYGEFHISGRKICIPSFRAEIWKFSIFQPRNLECRLCTTGFGLKYGKSHTSGRKFCAPSFLAEIWRNSQCTIPWEKRSGESVLWVLTAISVVTLISESVLSEDFPGTSGKQPVSFRKQKTRPKLLL